VEREEDYHLIMEILESYEFKRTSKSQYAKVVKALVEDGRFAVRMRRGEDFPENNSLSSVQGAVGDQIRKAGRRARTFAEPPDHLVVSLYAEGEGPTARRRPSRARAAA
jgi:hypothetical protein